MFPTDLPSYTPFTAPITLQALNHTSRHAAYERDIVLLAEKIGIDGSLDTSSLDYKVNTLLDTSADLSLQIAAIDALFDDLDDGSVAFATPAITSFTNSQHNHTNAAGGGKITSAAITSLDLSLTTLSNPYKFSVMRVNAANTTGGAFAKLTFDNEIFDTNSNFASGTYTVPVSGFYQFNAKVNAGSPSQFVIALYKNGSIYQRGGHMTNGSGIASALYAGIVQCAAGDTIEIWVYADNTVGYEVSATSGPYFSGFLVSTT